MSASIAFARLARHPEPPPDLAYAWLEAPAAARLAFREQVPDWHHLDAWPAGRLFGPAGEYRWQRRSRGEGIHAVLLLEPAAAFPPGFSPPLALQPTREAHLLLWGEWVDPVRDPDGNPDGAARFYARELPQVQLLPLDLGDVPPPAGATPRLTVRWYRDAAREKGDFLRCVEVSLRRDEDAEGEEAEGADAESVDAESADADSGGAGSAGAAHHRASQLPGELA
ncbi:MAG TPA: hypothetical protein VJA16_16235 [Thermoanaerobaculia bacterium]